LRKRSIENLLNICRRINLNCLKVPLALLCIVLVDNPFWIEEWKLRWLVSEDYNCKNAVKAMEEYSNYLLTNRFDVPPNAEKLLVSFILLRSKEYFMFQAGMPIIDLF
jgi:hypothetical protein